MQDFHQITDRLAPSRIRFDCRHYSGYKPCGKNEFCDDCALYAPWRGRVLIIKLAVLGDVLRTTTILPGLRKHLPDYRITWITDVPAIPLLKNNPMINSLCAMEACGMLTCSRMNYDLAINFEKEDRALALMDFISAREKRGFAFSPSGTLSIANQESLYALQLGLHDELKFRHNKKTYPEIIYEMAQIPYDHEMYVLAPSPQALEAAEDLKSRLALFDDRPTIGLNTGCGGVFETKSWTMDGFVALARRLISDGDCNLLLLGGAREAELNHAILEQAGPGLHSTGCANSLEDFIGIVNLCDVVVSSDSLAAHIAIGLGKQSVVFFGPTCPQEVDLFGRGEKIITSPPCAPCYLKKCRLERSCLADLDPDEVYKAVRRCMTGLPGKSAQ